MTTPEDNYDKLFEELLRETARVASDFDYEENDFQENDQQELSDRNALRRIKGFSTELQDISEAEYRQLQLERVVLVGVWTEGTAEMAENSMSELKALAETAAQKFLKRSSNDVIDQILLPILVLENWSNFDKSL